MPDSRVCLRAKEITDECFFSISMFLNGITCSCNDYKTDLIDMLQSTVSDI